LEDSVAKDITKKLGEIENELLLVDLAASPSPTPPPKLLPSRSDHAASVAVSNTPTLKPSSPTKAAREPLPVSPPVTVMVATTGATTTISAGDKDEEASTSAVGVESATEDDAEALKLQQLQEMQEEEIERREKEKIEKDDEEEVKMMQLKRHQEQEAEDAENERNLKEAESALLERKKQEEEDEALKLAQEKLILQQQADDKPAPEQEQEGEEDDEVKKARVKIIEFYTKYNPVSSVNTKIHINIHKCKTTNINDDSSVKCF
jgi:hypothetical protein